MNNLILHPAGETETGALVPFAGPVAVDTFGGRVHVEWDPQAAVTPLGQLPFFTEFLQVSGLFDPWVETALPAVSHQSQCAEQAGRLGHRGTVGSSGHQRYAHISALRGDTVNPPLLGMGEVVSEDSVRRNFGKIDEQAGVAWLQEHLGYCVAPLLGEPWILDADVTVKLLTDTRTGRSKAITRISRAAPRIPTTRTSCPVCA